MAPIREGASMIGLRALLAIIISVAGIAWGLWLWLAQGQGGKGLIVVIVALAIAEGIGPMADDVARLYNRR